MKRLKADDEFAATVGEDGECFVDNEYVGRLEGFRFAADPRALGIHGKALRAAALRGLQGEIAQRAYKLATAEDKDITLSEHGKLRWAENPVGRLMRGADPLSPRVELHADELLTPTAHARAQARLDQWVKDHIARTMAPLIALKRALDEAGDEKLDAPARGMAFRLCENLGSLMRAAIADDVRALQPQSRAKLRALGVRFGEFSIYLPALVKPAAAQLRALLWAVGQGMLEIPPPPQAGLTSVAVDEALSVAFYEAAGYRPLGSRAVRLDMLERLADLIRGKQKPEKPAEGEVEKPAPEKPQGFATTPEMMSILGCAEGELEGILRALGFKQTPVTMPEGAVVQMWRARRHAEEREQRRKKFEFVKKMKSSGESEKDRRAKREEKREEKLEKKSAPPPRKPKPEPRIDPNSPFAALAVLKTKR